MMKKMLDRTLDQFVKTVRGALSSGAPRYLIVGLGNPGPKYAGNRHNVGFMCVDHFAQIHDIAIRKRRFKANIGQGHVGPHHVVLLKPMTFMNDSGKAVAPASHWFKIPPERILVIHDDLDLPLGRLRLRPGGSSGGHKGINSIIKELGTRDFARLRIGIGRPQHGDPIDYVLDDFSRDQAPVIARACEWASEIIRRYLDAGIRDAMNEYNGRNPGDVDTSDQRKA